MKVKRSVEEWTIEQLIKKQTQLSFPDFQRERKLWSIPQKALLIDSILRDFDIPKLYFNQTEKDVYEVVDGQQRLWAIWDFFNDEYSCELNGNELKFSQLEEPKYKAVKETLKTYKMQITVFDKANEDYLRELFVRLQWGLLLVTGEKLHAASGQMKSFVFDDLAKRNFIQELGLPKTRTRYARETLCAQICINSFSRAQSESFARTRYDDLLNFFKAYAHPTGKDKVFFEQQTERIKTVVDELWQALGKDTESLSNRSYLLSVYLLFEVMAGKDGKVKDKKVKKQFGEFVLSLWSALKGEAKKGFKRTDEELYRFQAYLSIEPTERYHIEKRHNALTGYYEYYKKHAKIKGH
jgi:hypothetical protein